MMLRKIAAILFFFSAAAAQSTTYVAQFGHGGDGLSFAGRITIVNLGLDILDPARATIRSFDVAGNPVNLLRTNPLQGPTAANEVQVEIPGSGAEAVESLNDDPTQLTLGWVSITTDDNLAVEVLFNILDGGQLQTTTSILPRGASTAGTLLVAATEAAVSSLALLNPPGNQADASVTLNLFDRFGDPAGSTTVDLNPGQRIASSWRELIPALEGAADFLGTASFTSDVPVVVLPLRQDGVELTTQEVLPSRDD